MSFHIGEVEITADVWDNGKQLRSLDFRWSGVIRKSFKETKSNLYVKKKWALLGNAKVIYLRKDVFLLCKT